MQKDYLIVVCTFLIAFALLGSFWFISDLKDPVLAPFFDYKYEAPHDHSDPHDHADGMAHEDEDILVVPNKSHEHNHDEYIDITEDLQLSMQLSKDSVSGYNLLIDVQNFTFAPQQVGEEHLPGFGHAHVYLDNTKIARIYATAYHVDVNISGYENLTVTLNANSHEQLSYQGAPVEVTVNIEDILNAPEQHCHEFHCHGDHQ